MEQLMRCVLLVTLVSALWACPSSGGEAGYTDGSTPSEPRTVGDDPEPGEEEVVDEPICTPGATQNFCPTPNTITQCHDDGMQWIEVVCPGVMTCYQGACVDYACAPGSKMCLDLKTAAACLDDGDGGYAWSTIEECTGLCSEGECIGACGYDVKDKSGDDCEYWSIELTGNDDNACVQTHYLAVPSSGNSQVAVYDISTNPPVLHEGSPFATCSDPSRILMDGQTNVIATCRGDGHVRKHTTEGETVWDVQLPACWSVRGIAIGPEGRLFAGCTDTRKVHELDPATGDVLTTVQTQRDVYGMAVDQTGLYVSDFGGLTKLGLGGGDDDLQVVWQITSSGYGIAADGNGMVWLAQMPGLTSYDAETGAMVDNISIEGPEGAGFGDPFFWGGGMCNGVTVGLDGRIYAGCADSGNFVAIYDPNTDEIEYLSLPANDQHPRGVAVDADDNVYTLNMYSSNITRFDGVTHDAVSVTDGALFNPYGYSGDLTALQPCLIGGATTWISPVVDFGDPETTWLRVEFQATVPSGTSIAVSYRVDGSPWVQVLTGMEIGVQGQVFQVKASLVSELEGSAPTLDKLAVYYE